MKIEASKLQKILSLSVKLILFLSVFNALNLGLWHIMSTNIFLLILMFLPDFLKGREIKIPVEFEFLLLAFIITTLFLAKISGILAPLFFGIAVAFIGFMISLILYSNEKIKKDSFLIVLFSFCLSVTFGVALEIGKYYLKLLLNQEITAGIYEVAISNLTFVFLGALIASLSGLIYMKNKSGFLRKVFEKFAAINPTLFSRNSEPWILEAIKKGEDEKTEFKETLRYNLHTNEIDRKIEFASLKVLASFLNSSGGVLFLGVSDSGEIKGIQEDRFESNDRFLLHLSNIIKEKIGNKHTNLISQEIISVRDKNIVKIECKKSPSPVFLKTQTGEEFYIRNGPSSIQVSGSELVEYIDKKFKNKRG